VIIPHNKLWNTAVYSATMGSTKLQCVVTGEIKGGNHYRIRAYPIDPQQQFAFVTDLSQRGKTALRWLGVEFATVDVTPAE